MSYWAELAEDKDLLVEEGGEGGLTSLQGSGNRKVVGPAACHPDGLRLSLHKGEPLH